MTTFEDKVVSPPILNQDQLTQMIGFDTTCWAAEAEEKKNEGDNTQI